MTSIREFHCSLFQFDGSFDSQLPLLPLLCTHCSERARSLGKGSLYSNADLHLQRSPMRNARFRSLRLPGPCSSRQDEIAGLDRVKQPQATAYSAESPMNSMSGSNDESFSRATTQFWPHPTRNCTIPRSSLVNLCETAYFLSHGYQRERRHPISGFYNKAHFEIPSILASCPRDFIVQSLCPLSGISYLACLVDLPFALEFFCFLAIQGHGNLSHLLYTQGRCLA
jgi:hypothetical protein